MILASKLNRCQITGNYTGQRCSHWPRNILSVIGTHILTVQAHPEFDIEYARGLIGSRREIFDESLYKEGIDSLEKQNDCVLVAQWLVDFIDDGNE